MYDTLLSSVIILSREPLNLTHSSDIGENFNLCFQQFQVYSITETISLSVLVLACWQLGNHWDILKERWARHFRVPSQTFRILTWKLKCNKERFLDEHTNLRFSAYGSPVWRRFTLQNSVQSRSLTALHIYALPRSELPFIPDKIPIVRTRETRK